MDYRDRTTEEVEEVVRQICRESSSEEEIRQRIKEELEYDRNDVVVSFRKPETENDRLHFNIIRQSGGLVSANGCRMMIMMRGPQGRDISL